MICYILSFSLRSLTLKVFAFSEKSLSKDLINNQISYCPFTFNLFDFQLCQQCFIMKSESTVLFCPSDFMVEYYDLMLLNDVYLP